MSENVLISFIGSITLIINALIATISGIILQKLRKTNRSVEATKEQILNHHDPSPNYREQQDLRHEETRRWFTTIFRKINKVEENVNERFDSISSTVDELITGFLANRERIEKLEDKGNENE